VVRNLRYPADGVMAVFSPQQQAVLESMVSTMKGIAEVKQPGWTVAEDRWQRCGSALARDGGQP